MKKKTKITLCIASIIGIILIGGIIAYLIDRDTASNVFTVGKVKIDLQEPTWDSATDTDGDGIPDYAENLVPNKTIAKDPQIENIGSNDAYVYLKVKVPAQNLVTAQANGLKVNGGVAKATQLFIYTINENWTEIESQREVNRNQATGQIEEYAYVYYYNEALTPNNITNTLFDEVTFANVIDGQVDLSNQQINIEAYAIQTNNLPQNTTIEKAYEICFKSVEKVGEEVEEEAKIFAKLYTDGTLMLSSTDYTDETKTLEEGGDYGNVISETSGFMDYSDKEKVKKVVVKDRISPVGTGYWFQDCANLTEIEGTSNFDMSNNTSVVNMFDGCPSLTELDLSGWNITGDCSNMFYGCSNLTTLNLTNTIANITEAYAMFSNCSSLRELDLSGWNLIEENTYGIDCSFMFDGCSNLTTLNLANTTAHIADSTVMFEDCSSLTELDLSGWDTSSAYDMSYMFYNCSALTTLDLSGWNTSSVEVMYSMFENCSALTTLDLSGWDTSSVEDMHYMFASCSALTTLDLSGWDTSSVEYMFSMFSNCSALTTLDLSGWDITGDCSGVFEHCENLTTLNLTGSTANITEADNMFYYCSSLTELDLSGWDITGDCRNMFEDCSNLTILNLTNATANITNAEYMFGNCSSLTELDLSGWNITGDCRNMFEDCSNLTILNLTNATANITNAEYMFGNCSSLTELDLSNWDTSNLENAYNMFYCCDLLTTIYASETFTVSNVTDDSDMFYGCDSLVGGAGTVYSEEHTDKEYARIDGGTQNPGYFTLKTN